MIKFAFTREEGLDEKVVRLVIDVAFPGSQIDFSSRELLLIPDGKNPAQVRDAILKIPGITAIQWLEGGEVQVALGLPWGSD